MLFLTFITAGSHLLKKKGIEKGISHGISQQGSRCFALLKNKRFITVHASDLALGKHAYTGVDSLEKHASRSTTLV
jgi:hypothetical protein